MAADLDDEIRALYAGDPADFVGQRAALAKQHKDRAKELKALRKPERRAWALNRAGAEEPKGLTALVDAAAAVGVAQERGGDLRAATTALRDAVRVLASRTSDPGAATADLIAVVADPEALDDLAAGRLVRVPEAGGFGPLPMGGERTGQAERPVAALAPVDEEAERRREAEQRRAEQALAAAEKARDRAAAAHAKPADRLDEATAAERDAAARLAEAETAVVDAQAALDDLGAAG